MNSVDFTLILKVRVGLGSMLETVSVTKSRAFWINIHSSERSFGPRVMLCWYYHGRN